MDTVHIWLDKDSARNIDFLAETPQHLTDVRTSEKDNVINVNGRVKNLKVNVFDHGVSIKGSIPKYYLDDNFNTLQRQDT